MSGSAGVVILGAGPAGSALAILAARSGLRTVLVERARFPRDKVCGEFVSAEGCRVLERLGLGAELREAGAAPIDSCRITDRRGRSLDFPLPRLTRLGREGLGIRRSRLDLMLARAAERSGVEIRERWEARAPILRDGKVRGIACRPVGRSATEALTGAVIVAADGRRSLLARQLHPRLCDPTRTHRRSWFGLRTHLQGARAIEPRVELHLFDGGYVGLAPIEGGASNLCMLVTAGVLRDCGGSPDAVLARRLVGNPAVRDILAAHGAHGPWSSCGPLRFGARRAAAAGALFVGDAAGTVDPFCGEGISHALIGAELALPFVVEAAARGELTEDLARGYSLAWRRTFAATTRRARALGLLFARPRLAGLVLAALRGPGEPLAGSIAAMTRTGARR